MRESVERKIAGEFAIDANEKVEVEFRGHPSAVVVGGDQGLDILAEVHADDRLAARTYMLTHSTEERNCIWRQEIAERAPGKKGSPRTRWDVGWNVEVSCEVGNDRA